MIQLVTLRGEMQNTFNAPPKQGVFLFLQVFYFLFNLCIEFLFQFHNLLVYVRSAPHVHIYVEKVQQSELYTVNRVWLQIQITECSCNSSNKHNRSWNSKKKSAAEITDCRMRLHSKITRKKKLLQNSVCS